MQSRLTPLRFARSIFCTRSGHKRALCALRCGKCFANLGRLHYRLHIICFSFFITFPYIITSISLLYLYNQKTFDPLNLRNFTKLQLIRIFIYTKPGFNLFLQNRVIIYIQLFPPIIVYYIFPIIFNLIFRAF